MPASRLIRLATMLAAAGLGGPLLLPGTAAATPGGDTLFIDFSPTGQFSGPDYTGQSSESVNGASGSIQLSPGPQIQATSSATEDVTVQLDYSFEIDQVAGAPVASVPFEMSYLEELTNETGSTHATGQFHISQGTFFSGYIFGQNHSDSAGSVTTGNTSTNYINTTFSSFGNKSNIQVGTPVSLEMFAFASGPGGSAFVDPVITIDSADCGCTPSDFTITESTGVGNTIAGPASSVPEPATGALLLTAFGLVTSIARKIRSRT